VRLVVEALQPAEFARVLASHVRFTDRVAPTAGLAVAFDRAACPSTAALCLLVCSLMQRSARRDRSWRNW